MKRLRAKFHPERPRRLARPRTSPFHGGNTGSNPVGDARKYAVYSARSEISHNITQQSCVPNPLASHDQAGQLSLRLTFGCF